ncbi:MAG: hypothetical protein KDI13_01180 [Alphaproteobacteria bacterium]|nr:hypothetical protein [Alphaproteobacteria bacterium]
MSEHQEEDRYLLEAITCKIKEDGIVDEKEASFLFDIQERIDGIAAEEGFHDLFVNALTSYLLFDKDAPGTLSTTQFVWLKEHVTADHLYTSLESDLIKNLIVEAETLPPGFHEWVWHMETHLKDFAGDLDTLEYEKRTSFYAELKALLERYFPHKD